MKWSFTSLVVLAALEPVLARIDPTAPATPCVPSRTVPSTIQTDIALGCQEAVDITNAVCTDYLAQEILAAISYFCGNQTEAFKHCNSIPNLTTIDCQGFDPSGAGGPNCTQEALDAYNICGNSTDSGLFAAGDPVSLAQCLHYDLSLCTPEDGEGHYNALFTGQAADCAIPQYAPACGVYSTSSSAPTSTAALASPSSSTAGPSFSTTETSSSTAFETSACPVGQTLIAYTTVYF